MRVLGAGDPGPVIVHNPGAAARFLIVCDHAGRATPRRLGDLGLPPEAFDQHIAWDIGAGEVATRLGAALGATVIRQHYSRLVIDCNRAPGRDDSIPTASDGWIVAGNQGLSLAEVQARIDEIHRPYHAAIAAEIEAAAAGGAAPILVMIHSFTPTMRDQARPWSFGVLHDHRSAYSIAVLRALRAAQDALVGDNEPYAMDGIDYTAPLHAHGNGLDFVELEIRQDLIADDAGAERVAALLAKVLPLAADAVVPAR